MSVDRYAVQGLHESQRRQVVQTLAQFRAELEKALSARLLLARGLAAFAKDRPDMTYTEFAVFAQDLLEHQEGIRSIQWAPHAVVTHVYPIAGNEAAIGHDLRADPARRKAVDQAIRDRQFVVAGPVRLRQGGVALVARLPVYADSGIGNPNHGFIGFSTILVDMDDLYRASQLSEFEKTLCIALRGQDGLGEQGAVFYGEEYLFSQPTAEISSVTLPYGHWRIAAELREPFVEAWPSRWPLVVITLLVISLVMWLNRRVWMAEIALKMNLVGLSQKRQEVEAAHYALQCSEEKLRQIFEAMSSGVILYEALEDGADFLFKEVNAAVEHSELISRDQLIGRRLRQTFPGVEAFGLLEVLQRVWRTGKSECLPAHFYQDNRISGWRESFVCRLSSGEVVVIYDDVTGYKTAETTLKERENRYRAVIESARDGFWTIDHEGRLLEVNQSYIERSGYSRDELLTMRVLDLDAVERPEDVTAHIKKVMTAGNDLFETVHRAKDGTFWPVEIIVSYWPHSGEGIFICLSSRHYQASKR